MGIESVANFRSYGFRKNMDEASAHLTANAQTSSGKAEQATSKDRLSTAKKNVLGFAKALLKSAGDFALDRVVGAGVAVGAVNLENAPMIKQIIKNAATMTVRYIYIDGPKRMADIYVGKHNGSPEKTLRWKAVYRAFQALSALHPLAAPSIALIDLGTQLIERQRTKAFLAKHAKAS